MIKKPLGIIKVKQKCDIITANDNSNNIKVDANAVEIKIDLFNNIMKYELTKMFNQTLSIPIEIDSIDYIISSFKFEKFVNAKSEIDVMSYDLANIVSYVCYIKHSYDLNMASLLLMLTPMIRSAIKKVNLV